MRTVSNSKLDKGNHTFKVELSDLSVGLNYYVMTNGKDRTTQKIHQELIEKDIRLRLTRR